MEGNILYAAAGNGAVRQARLDITTQALTVIPYEHHNIHSGSRFYVNYSVASLGALTTPTDMMTLTWTTPNTAKWSHFTFSGTGTGGWLMKLIEGSTGGGATPTASLTILNHNRNSSKTSASLDVAGTPAAGKVSYDATQLTGGLTIWEEYIAGGNFLSGSGGSDRDEIILKQNTTYQLSLYGTETNPASLHLDWYEHTNKPVALGW